MDVIGCSGMSRADLAHVPTAQIAQRRTGAGFVGGHAMTDLECRLDRFEALAADCELIAKLATDGAKRELYLRLALHYRELLADMRKAIATKAAA
jgi:hypothetical protein